MNSETFAENLAKKIFESFTNETSERMITEMVSDYTRPSGIMFRTNPDINEETLRRISIETVSDYTKTCGTMSNLIPDVNEESLQMFNTGLGEQISKVIVVHVDEGCIVEVIKSYLLSILQTHLAVQTQPMCFQCRHERDFAIKIGECIKQTLENMSVLTLDNYLYKFRCCVQEIKKCDKKCIQFLE